MKRDLTIALFQYDISWENPNANLRKVEKTILNANGRPDILILPETFTTGFTNNAADVAVTMQDKPLKFISKLANENGIAISGSMIIRDGNNYYNRFVFADPEGEIHYYDKRHLFTMSGEDKIFSPGNRRVVIEYRGWKIMPQICYDLRFPTWSRNTDRYDLLIYVANWPEPRYKVWDNLLMARAIENQSYVVGVNRTGRDGKKISYRGNSVVIDPKGEPVIKAGKSEEWINYTLSMNDLITFRKKFPVLNDMDGFTLEM